MQQSPGKCLIGEVRRYGWGAVDLVAFAELVENNLHQPRKLLARTLPRASPTPFGPGAHRWRAVPGSDAGGARGHK